MDPTIKGDELLHHQLAPLNLFSGMSFDGGKAGVRSSLRGPGFLSQFCHNQRQQNPKCHGKEKRAYGENCWLPKDAVRKFHHLMPSPEAEERPIARSSFSYE